MSRLDVVAVANEKVPIVTVAQMLGVQLPEDVGAGRSRKVPCPFGDLYHSDGGVSAAMRVYPETNSAYCFSCSAYYTPVSLAAKAMDLDRRTAAVRLLDRIGYKPLDVAVAWQRAAAPAEPEPNRALLAHALKTYCGRIDPYWSHRQLEPSVARVLSRCLGLLDLVKSADDVRLWLDRCKEAMRRVLHVEKLSPSEKYDVLWNTLQGDEGTGACSTG